MIWSDLRTILRTDVVKDVSSTKWSDAILLRFANAAIRDSWPGVFVRVTDATTEISETAGIADYINTEYGLPSGVPDDASRKPLYCVELGPISGQRDSDAKQYSDRWLELRSGIRQAPAWEVDYGRRKLILKRRFPWYDDSGTYSYFLRMHYVRPVTALSADSDTIEGPDTLIQFIMASVQYQAFRQLTRAQVSNRERLQNVGMIMKEASEELERVRKRMRMTWPSIRA